jgi:hypothetical protein
MDSKKKLVTTKEVKKLFNKLGFNESKKEIEKIQEINKQESHDSTKDETWIVSDSSSTFHSVNLSNYGKLE